MRICSNCHNENPSVANCCMFCGTMLVEKELLPEEVLLRQQLAEANKTIEDLKKKLSALQDKSENTSDSAEIQQLKVIISNKNETIKTLIGKLEVQQSTISELTKQLSLERDKNKHGGSWGVFFVFLFLITAIAFYVTWKKDKNNINRWNSLYYELDNSLNELRSSYPLIIDDIQIANVYSGGSFETNYGGTIYKENAMYLKPKLIYKGFYNGEKKFYVKWIRPNGTLMYNEKISPEGFTFSQNLSIDSGDNRTIEMGEWGWKDKGNWPAGTSRIEIWYGDVMLKSKNITIYQKGGIRAQG